MYESYSGEKKSLAFYVCVNLPKPENVPLPNVGAAAGVAEATEGAAAATAGAAGDPNENALAVAGAFNRGIENAPKSVGI